MPRASLQSKLNIGQNLEEATSVIRIYKQNKQLAPKNKKSGTPRNNIFNFFQNFPFKSRARLGLTRQYQLR